ncbi:permease prefix domain 1-containing protein [Leifsonia sp. YIM 134122]|uniref:Permease prefix domain 1-containing protein n=1 Tax=Leifsonia stereocauli TaxID=3134136 RepID=A0ABU9WAV9_9MICO
MTDSTPRRSGGDLHRLLDEAFAGVDMTPDAQDLKEEVRANLIARVADLEASGSSTTDAARQAIDELGDVRELAADAVGAPSAPGTSPAASATGAPASPPDPATPAGGRGVSPWNQNAAYLSARVRPKPAFVVRIVSASLVALAALTVAGLAAAGVLVLPLGVTILMIGIGAAAVGWIVGDSLVQETTTNHPMPQRRGVGYAIATFLTVAGLGFGALMALGAVQLWGIAIAAVGLVAGIVLFSFLGATQTNRHKAWLRQAQREMSVGNRFEEEPESAARFGIYTAVIWIVAFAAFIVLSLTVGWLWSWLALLGGFVVMMLVLAQMLFGSRKG